MTKNLPVSLEDDDATSSTISNARIDTSGGTYVAGNTDAGRDFIGRDRVTIGQQIIVVMGGSRRTVAPHIADSKGESPYRGMEAFDVVDAPLFFGRHNLTQT